VPKLLVLIAAITVTLLVTIVNFINLKSVPNVGLGYEDKIYHTVVYLIFAFLWGNWCLLHYSKRTLWVCALLCLIYGIALELLQHSVNSSRTFDLADLLSNCTGVVFGTIIVALFMKQKVKLN
jgi:VanZ family protein